jgi:uncharacterized protein YjeT (DUF2065 family)
MRMQSPANIGLRRFTGHLMQDLFAALCLVAVIEGLLLLLAPDAWKRMALQLLELPSNQLRSCGAGALAVGLLLLWLLRH